MLWKQCGLTYFHTGKTSMHWYCDQAPLKFREKAQLHSKNCFGGWIIDSVKAHREMLNWNKKLVLWLCCSWMPSFSTSQALQKSNSDVLFGWIWSFSVFAVSGMASGVMAEHKPYFGNPCVEKIPWEKRICEIPKCIMTKLKVSLLGFVLEYVLKSIWNPFYSFLLWAFWANSLRKNASYCICQAVFISCICYDNQLVSPIIFSTFLNISSEYLVEIMSQLLSFATSEEVLSGHICLKQGYLQLPCSSHERRFIETCWGLHQVSKIAIIYIYFNYHICSIYVIS